MKEWSVKRIYGYPGDGIDRVINALDRAKKGMGFIWIRHGGNGGIYNHRPSKVYG